jgi:asparagine synthase (glutamine-hydrolysing)
MCGIAGFVDRSKDRNVLEAMTDAIARRGPDDHGYYLEGGVGLGHRRLAIIDLSPLGRQPMRFGTLLIVFNGEIYNYAEVQKELIGLGYDFTSSSDTEVVLKAFHRWGPDCVQRFIGMFAFAVYDEAEKTLWLVRDRAGVKPLFYAWSGDRLAFGSSLHCFKPYLDPRQRDEIDPDALSDFLTLGYVGAERSILKAVRKLPQGCYARFSGGALSIHRYWDVRFEENEAWRSRSLDDIVDELEELAVSAFRYRMVADVPVGVFLSAGVDSSLVTAILAKHHGSLRTFTIGFSEAGYDESRDAARIAAQLGTNHTDRILSAERAADILEHYYDIYDEPHGDSSGLATTFVSELAKENGVKVVLSADAGDELFGGYIRYLEFLARWSQVERLGSAGRAAAGGALHLLGAVMPGFRGETYRRQSALLADQPFLSFMHRRIAIAGAADLQALYPAYRERLPEPGVGGILAQMSEWDFKNYMVDDILVKVDRATMYHSIEGREPMLDHRIVEFAAQLPSEFKVNDGRTKVALKHLLGRYLPKELYDLPKRGFSPPIKEWVAAHFRNRFVDVLDSSGDMFERRELSDLIRRYRRGDKVNYPLLWYLFNFQRWYLNWTAKA